MTDYPESHMYLHLMCLCIVHLIFYKDPYINIFSIFVLLTLDFPPPLWTYPILKIQGDLHHFSSEKSRSRLILYNYSYLKL